MKVKSSNAGLVGYKLRQQCRQYGDNMQLSTDILTSESVLGILRSVFRHSQHIYSLDVGSGLCDIWAKFTWKPELKLEFMPLQYFFLALKQEKRKEETNSAECAPGLESSRRNINIARRLKCIRLLSRERQQTNDGGEGTN